MNTSRCRRNTRANGYNPVYRRAPSYTATCSCGSSATAATRAEAEQARNAECYERRMGLARR